MKPYLYGLLALVAAFFVWKGGVFAKDVYDKVQLVNDLETQLIDRTLENESLQSTIEQMKQAQIIADRTVSSLNDKLVELGAISDRVMNSKEEDDGPVAPVLRDTLDALRLR